MMGRGMRASIGKLIISSSLDILSGYDVPDKSATQGCRFPTSLQGIKNGNISLNMPGMMFACHQIATEQNLAQLAAFERHLKLQVEGCK
jgi:hypothetical protein